MQKLRTFSLLFGLALACEAGIVRERSFEQIVDASDIIVHGTVISKMAAWDAEHRFIWTHYRISVADPIKGAQGAIVTVSEIGGTVGSDTLRASSTVEYTVDEEVIVFLQLMPTGVYRSTGLEQGKFVVSQRQMFTAAHVFSSVNRLSSIQPVDNLQGTRLPEVDNTTVTQFKNLIRARLTAKSGKGVN